ncbi:hypothetical protein AHMF7605_16930 [Adhaeribacter arboris]|uniref:Uncharacterized protein n=1 Tax=Adhaeribacter arboris TaxID=2072846 RepID=A0A2T2YHR9_9BACT|nr:hypothetical protein [Adhaeribacter arboris]PSR55066.1 hypothetical protein AHMF7605_16930 [Adhaeribacter arboris]
MTFEEDLTKRHIDITAFAVGDPERYAAWRLLYEQVHPNTFYTSVKMVINEVRRQFWLQEVPKPTAASAPTTAKPVVRRATGTVPSTASAIPDEPSPSVNRTPEPAPRTRPIIRRPAVTETAVPEEKEPVPEKPAPTNTEATSPEAPNPGRARPVFRRPAAETTGNTSAESEIKSETKPEIAPEVTSPSTDGAKPPRPRPVFRKPGSPDEKATEAGIVNEFPDGNSATSLPEHSNPNPTEGPKPARPRPVFKRPAPVNSIETEKAAATPESPVSTNIPAEIQTKLTEEKSVETSPETPKPPRPRPVFKRPAPTNVTETPETKAVETKTEVNPEPTSTPEAPKFPRPRPVMKRPLPPAEPTVTESSIANVTNVQSSGPEIQNLENSKQEALLNEPSAATTTPLSESSEVPVAPKTPRPRPIFKRPTQSDSPENTTNNNSGKE